MIYGRNGGTQVIEPSGMVEVGADDGFVARSRSAGPGRPELRGSCTLDSANGGTVARPVVGIFPSDVSALRLITMRLVEQNDEWAVGRRYFSLESLAELNTPPPTRNLTHADANPDVAEAA